MEASEQNQLGFMRGKFGRATKFAVKLGSIPEKGAVAFLLDLMVAEGRLIREWAEEKNDYAYREPDIRTASHFAV